MNHSSKKMKKMNNKYVAKISKKKKCDKMSIKEKNYKKKGFA